MTSDSGPAIPVARTALVLAAGTISAKLGFLRSRVASPALVPVNTRPLAAYLIEHYVLQHRIPVTLVVSADAEATVRAELGTLGAACTVIGVEPTDGVVDTLRRSLQRTSLQGEIIVNVVTTIPSSLPVVGEVLLANQATEGRHWSGVVLGEDSVEFSFKASENTTASFAFTGVFNSRADELLTAVSQVSEPRDLLAVVEALHRLSARKFKQGPWIDCGHETNYYEAKADLISSRSFNRVQVSLWDGTITKHSQDHAKLSREVDYVQALPAEVAIYFPRVLGRDDLSHGQTHAVRMEYYGYPTLGEYFLHWDIGVDNWIRIFRRLGFVLKRFSQYPCDTIDRDSLQRFYLGKTVSRIATFLDSLPLDKRQLLTGEIRINGVRCRPFEALLPEVRKRIAASFRPSDLCVMHGDYCFNNILYDIPSGVVRLIDPRGSFGDERPGIYGDRKYDLAKLKHSAEDGYDFIVNGLFTVQASPGSVDYTLPTRENTALVSRLCRELIAEQGYDHDELSLLTALLFLSMCPLHADNANRQLLFYAHGLALLNQALNK